jgi:hypothetical protein
MYHIALSLHSLLRWVVLVSATTAVARGCAGWFGHRAWTSADADVARWFTLSITLQFALGLVLWAGLSPYGLSGFDDMAAVMKDAVRRFWAVEHLTMMLLALALAHVGAARVRKASSDAGRHKATVVFFGLALALTLAAIPWVGANARPLVRLPF